MTIRLAGDSTVAPPKPLEHPLSGWGGYLHEYVADDIVNYAVGGATTASFIDEGRWPALLNDLQPGDTVIIQFGHNDQKARPLSEAMDAYRDRLTSFLDDVRAKGATPVLATSPERRLFTDDGLRMSHGGYPQIVRDLGRDEDVPVIDLTAFTRWLYTWLGRDDARCLFVHFGPGESQYWPDGVHDDTHFNTHGARALAAFVAHSLDAVRRSGEHIEPAGRWGVQP
ncbi:rhamnogalacturonan acetylesterase [Planctomonas sp. JC2975]|uniref:rhamnogalacturonan acetylesterase n=1 Tax=Planctomonas sp. JC2975 TaxID=2729626 RepID=UPI0014763B15|nr:rhamnogalacturonan acetylesterase [Planctomonas sp. JC2975]NNC12766.1 rhamnogalacturonan acetylesterase [Planctomonas sp. JC2975]